MRWVRVVQIACALALGCHPACSCEIHGTRLPAELADVTVLIETEMGEIEVAVDLLHAPLTACNFLKHVAGGAYNGGAFARTLRADNQGAAPVPISVIQAYPNQDLEQLPAIPLERTRDTGLRHVDGVISMARRGTDDATSKFFICIGDQPELDFAGRRNPDGQGFAAFGRVTRGMSIVRRIQAGTAHGEQLTPPISIRTAHISSQ